MTSPYHRHHLIIPLHMAALTLLLASHVVAAGVVTGAVYVEGSALQLAGVAVSDGEQVVVTDQQGRYHLEIGDDFALIRISVPSGYRPRDDRWFDRVHVDGPVRLDFVLVPEDQPDSWTFVHVTDVHITEALVDHVRGFTSDVNTLTDPRPALVASTGDLIHDIVRNSADHDQLRDAFAMYADAMSGLQMPLLNVVGNHDLAGYRADMDLQDPLFDIGAYKRFLGPGCYSYGYGGVRFIALNNTVINIPLDGRYHSAIAERCLRWLAADLSVADEHVPIILLMHQPPGAVRNGDELMTLLEGRTVLGIFHGHRHSVRDEQYEGIPCFESGSLARCHNAPTGYRLVTVSNEVITEATYRTFPMAVDEQTRLPDDAMPNREDFQEVIGLVTLVAFSGLRNNGESGKRSEHLIADRKQP